jgi:pimeloyl-ACP methyl ester carboxylesterase
LSTIMIDIEENQSEVERRALLADLATELDQAVPAVPVRRWMQSPTAGHIAALFWGTSPAELAFVHDLGDSANGWDAVSIALGRPVASIDLPGHGRSSGAAAVPSPARAASALLDGLWSHAREADTVVATGYGAAVALHAAARRPGNVRSLIVVDGGPIASGIFPPAAGQRFIDADAAAAALGEQAPGRGAAFLRWLVAEATVPAADGWLEWRSRPARSQDDATWQALTGLAEVSVPIGVVLGESGQAVDPLVAALLERRPDAITVSVDGAGDLLGTAPSALATAIDDLASTLAPAGPRTITGSRAGAA